MNTETENSDGWADIPGWEGLYQVDGRGRVRSVRRYANGWRGGRILRPVTHTERGRRRTPRRQVTLADGERRATFYIDSRTISPARATPEQQAAEAAS
ncbi:NUMOD4 domain-containing protein [Mycolicibacterium sp. XJ1819]